MLRFINKKPDEKSLLCTGKLSIYSHRVTTPIRVIGISLSQVTYLVNLYDVLGDFLKQYNILTPVFEIDIDVRKGIFEEIKKSLERYADYINEVKRRFHSYSFVIPFFSAEISKKIIKELDEYGRSYTLSVFLSHYVGQECIDILSLPVLKTQIYDRDRKRRIHPNYKFYQIR